MSKMDNLRAMREARYEADRARAKAAGTGSATPPASRTAATPRSAAPAPGAAPAAGGATAPDGLCGHRNMGGRTCTREQGHAAQEPPLLLSRPGAGVGPGSGRPSPSGEGQPARVADHVVAQPAPRRLSTRARSARTYMRLLEP